MKSNSEVVKVRAKRYRGSVNMDELRKDFIYACVKRGITSPEDMEDALCHIPHINYAQVAGIRAAITKGQLG